MLCYAVNAMLCYAVLCYAVLSLRWSVPSFGGMVIAFCPTPASNPAVTLPALCAAVRPIDAASTCITPASHPSRTCEGLHSLAVCITKSATLEFIPAQSGSDSSPRQWWRYRMLPYNVVQQIYWPNLLGPIILRVCPSSVVPSPHHL